MTEDAIRLAVMAVLVATPLGDRIRRLRQEREWSQEQLAIQASRAGAAGVSRGWLSQVESGEIDKPRADLLNQVARALGVTVDFLLNGHPPEGVTLTVDPEKAPALARIARLPAELLSRYERAMADLFGLHDYPASDESDYERGEDRSGNGPDTSPDGERKRR